MTDTVGRLIIIALIWAGMLFQLYQSSRIKIPLRKAAFFKGKWALAIVLLGFLIALYVLNLHLLDWLIVGSAVLFIPLSQYNKGFTKGGIISYESGTALRGMFSREYPFEETTDWVLLEDSDSLTFAFNSRQSRGFEKELTFDQKHKEAVLTQLAAHNIKVKVAEKAGSVDG